MARQCKYCGADSGNYELCKACYYDFEDGLIDKCACGNFKDAEYDVCLDCFKKQDKQETRKKTKVSDSSIKGKIAEAIIEEMFISMGYRVFRFGMENTLPGFANRELPHQGEVANEIRKMPDFIVISPDKKNPKINYIEVKYRTSGEFNFNQRYKGNYPYSNAYFILVSPKHIKIQKASELEKGEDFVYLNKCRDFETDKEIILQYIEFCKKFFANC